ncbi:N-acetyltransferase [Halobacteriales archaeon QS_1_68_17]|nr:MAG: N-acetyltransferase [Halobacteriales archaeon QS_1_68_17]
MEIREATPDDLEGIRRVAEESWRTDYPGILNRENVAAAVDEWYGPERLAGEIDRDTTLLLVAGDGAVVGFAHALWNRGEGHVLRLYVAPDARGEGTGRALLDRACADLFDRGVDRVTAMVLAANDPGNDFYRTFGFGRVDRGETTIGGEQYAENVYALARDDYRS